MGQEATVRTGHGKTGSKLRKEYNKAVYCHSACLTYMQCTTCEMQSEARIKIVGRSINNLRYAYDTTLMAESEEELKSLMMRVKVQFSSVQLLSRVKHESEKTGLKLRIQKTKIMGFCPITSWQIEGEKVVTVAGFIFLGSKITADGDCSHEIKRLLPLGRKAMTNLRQRIEKQRYHFANKDSYSQSYGFSSSHVWM